ncbi:MAG: hypothetical protein KatS3mg068_0701 [Candidatus Sericytochromatia bacterium]|nr:MAG: hypothetical protein KatS3mg068_0701 [Candidatus Sericytochromatia bacterium]
MFYRIFYRIIIVLIYFVLSNTVEAKPIIFEGTITADILNVRKEANIESQIIASLRKDTKVVILDISKDKNWYKIGVQGKIGWISKAFVKAEINGSINYSLSNSVGILENSVLNSPIKIYSNDKYIYVIDFTGKYELKIYNKENFEFIRNIYIDYKWIINDKERENIIITADLEGNYYTNNTERSTINKFDINGNKISEIKNTEIIDINSIQYHNDLLYVFDNTKNIKVFDKNNNIVNRISLTETILPKKFFVDEDKIYVLDYPENQKETYKVIYVNTYNFGLRRNYDTSFKLFKLFNKGSILKYDSSFKILKSKDLLEDNKIKENEWLEIVDNNEKLYCLLDEIKILDVLGEIDVYNVNGEFIKTYSLNDNYQLTTPDRHKNYFKLDLVRKIYDIYSNNDEIVMSVISSTKNFNQSSINYYFINPQKNEYRMSHYYDIDIKKNFASYFDGENIFSLDKKGYFNVIDKNFNYKKNLGASYIGKFSIPYKVDFLNNKIVLFDKGNYSFGFYDLNFYPIKIKSLEQKSDLFEYLDFILKNNKIYLFKKAQFEKNKLGIEVYDENLNKIFDKWLLDIDSETFTKFCIDDKENILIPGKGNFFGKKGILFMFNKFGHLINNWEDETAIVNSFSEEERKEYRATNLKILGFDNNSNAYIMIMDKSGQYKILSIKITEERKNYIVKEISKDFFGDTRTITKDSQKNEFRQFNDAINGEILSILETKNNILYFLFKENNNNNIRLGVFDSTGTFWKEYSFGNNSSIKNLSLDNQENLFVTDNSSVKKYSN